MFSFGPTSKIPPIVLETDCMRITAASHFDTTWFTRIHWTYLRVTWLLFHTLTTPHFQDVGQPFHFQDISQVSLQRPTPQTRSRFRRWYNIQWYFLLASLNFYNLLEKYLTSRVAFWTLVKPLKLEE